MMLLIFTRKFFKIVGFISSIPIKSQDVSIMLAINQPEKRMKYIK